MTADRHFSAADLPGPLRFADADAVLDVVQAVLVGWQLREQTADNHASHPVLTVAGSAGRWRVTGATLEAGMWFDDPVSAACCVAAHLLQAQMQAEQEMLCLHAAAVEIGGGLVVMPCRYRAGKSALTAALAAAGCRVFGDDVVLIDRSSGDAAAPGMAIRLRLPLPERLDRPTRAFVDSHAGPQGAHYCYLAPPETALARRGERAPVRAFVLLDRREAGPATLTRVAPGPMLRQLIWQNFARAGAPERIVETLAALIERADCLQLTYSDLAAGRSLLLSHFTARGRTLHEVPAAGLCPDTAAPETGSALALRGGDRLARSTPARRLSRAGETFLTTAATGSILHLNALASCLWTLLEQPLTYGEVLATFTAAFPAKAEPDLDRDLRETLAVFKTHGLIEVREQPSAPRRRRSTLAAAALGGALAWTQPAGAMVIGGCEGRDISALLAPAATAEWQGEARELAPLRFAHGLTLTCDGETCRVDGGLRDLGPPARPATATTLGRTGAGIAGLPLGSAPPTQSREIVGERAAHLTEALERHGWRDDAGDLRFVWVDYGHLAGRVNLRARSEIRCAVGANACTLWTTVLAHVAYSERRPCPQFGAP